MSSERPAQRYAANLPATAGRAAKRLARGTAGLLLAALAVALPLAASAQAPQPSQCGELSNGFGPFDYRTNRGADLANVEGSHFSPVVEALIRGIGGYIGADLDYVLRAFPNHHRALLAMSRLTEKEKTEKPRGARYVLECYYERAARFAPDDSMVPMLYADLLIKRSRPDEARNQLARALQLARDNPFTHYNLGLIFFELKDYDQSLAQAHRASALGMARPDLRDKLKAAGKWREPSAAPAPTGSDAAATPNAAASGNGG